MTTIIKPGMLIRGLREDGAIDTVLRVLQKHNLVEVATKGASDGCLQTIESDAEVRWPWEDTWTPLNRKHMPHHGDLYVHRDGRSTYMVVSCCEQNMLVCVSDGARAPCCVGIAWSHSTLFGGDDDAFEYVGRAEDILRVDA